MTIEELASLYSKIEKGEATDKEKLMFKSGLAISCIDEKVLMMAIQQEASKH